MPRSARPGSTPLQSDAERVPAAAILPPAGNQRDLNRLDKLDVQSSKRLAALVALRALGRKVTVTGGGVRIDLVEPSAPAHAAGLAPGMVVTAIDGTKVRSLSALRTVLAPRKAGRDGEALRARRHAPEDDLARASCRIRRRRGTRCSASRGEDVAPNVKLPISVRIDTGNLGGPSAGLAFALEIYDSLTGRKLSRGRHVAVTGTIDQDGKVGLVGGIQGKTIGARNGRLRPHARPDGRGRDGARAFRLASEGRRGANVRRRARRVAEVAARCGGRSPGGAVSTAGRR